MKKFTTSQVWLIHSLEVTASGAVVAAVIALYTAIQTGNLTSAGVAVAAAAGAVLSKGVSGLMSNPQTVQAAQDTAGDLKQAVQAMIGSHNALLNMFNAFLQQQQSAPVVAAAPVPVAPQPVQPVQQAPITATVPPALSLPTSIPSWSSVMPVVQPPQQ